MPRKLKTFLALGVQLWVKKELAASNGNRQFCICVRTTTKKRVWELLKESGNEVSLFVLNSFHGLWVNNDYSFTPPEPEKIYFHQEHPNAPHFREWLALDEWKEK